MKSFLGLQEDVMKEWIFENMSELKLRNTHTQFYDKTIKFAPILRSSTTRLT